MAQFALKPRWAIDYLTHEKFSLPQLDAHIAFGGSALSIGRYFTELLDPSFNWADVEEMVRLWDGQFCLKGVMSAADARKAVDIGCTGIVLSNHGGRQLDGSRSAFDQLAEIVDAVGDRIDVMIDGGISAAPTCSRRCRWGPRRSASAAIICSRWRQQGRRGSTARSA